jgi:hypothetical protein
MSNKELYPENYDCRDPIQFAELELKLSGFADTDYGKAALEYIKQTYKIVNDDINGVRNLHTKIMGLVNQVPLSPLLEEELVNTETLDFYNGAYIKIFRREHPRVPFVYERDGRFYDDRAVGFVNEDGNVWYGSNGKHVSRKEISFPYFRQEEIVKVESQHPSTPGHGHN